MTVFLNPLAFKYHIKTIIITNKINPEKILYKSPSLNEKRPNAAPLFQIKIIFKNDEENISISEFSLLRLNYIKFRNSINKKNYTYD